MSSRVISAIDRVRVATDAQHRALETLPRLERLFADDYRLDEYVDLLCRMLGFHRAAERCLLRVDDPALAQIAVRCKASAAIELDLCALGARCGDDAGEAPLAIADGDAARIGLLYVLEGSQIGALVIRRHLERHFASLPDLRYHAASGGQAAAWRATKTTLDDLLHETNVGDAIEGARATFACLQRWLA